MCSVSTWGWAKLVDDMNGQGGASSRPHRILQIHPMLRCNLRCSHCYSDSSPRAATSVAADHILEAVADAAQLGYNVLSVSGGEPLLWRNLDEVCGFARSRGMKVQLASNGTLLSGRRLSDLKGLVDLYAVSLDGPEKLHNTIRKSDRAFAGLLDGIRHMSDTRTPFGIIYTLTRKSVKFLPWAAEFAARSGASLFQIHPLELAGRATDMMAGETLSQTLLQRAYVATFLLRTLHPGMRIQLDLLHKEALADVLSSRENLAGELISPLVVEADGSVVPLAYGIARDYAVCNLRDQRLSEAWPAYRSAGGYSAFQELCSRAAEAAMEREDIAIVNWYELVVQMSRSRDRSIGAGLAPRHEGDPGRIIPPRDAPRREPTDAGQRLRSVHAQPGGC